MTEIEEIKQRITAEDLARMYNLSLTRKGLSYWCLCPFHDDKRPSMQITDNYKGGGATRWQCWSGCGGGSVIDFVIKSDEVSISEAVEKLKVRVKGQIGSFDPMTLTENQRVTQKNRVVGVNHIDPTYMKRSADNGESALFFYLSGIFGEENVLEVFARYHVGRTKDRATIFWQVDELGRVRSGKIMHYKADGHRDKDKPTTWAHSVLIKAGRLSDEFSLSQCLFGQHLINETSAPVALVESEKTAIIGALCYPSVLWLATGGKSGLSAQRLEPLKDRIIRAYPDADAKSEWGEKCEDLRAHGYSITLSNVPLTEKQDVADVLLQHYTDEKPTKYATFGRLSEISNFSELIKAFSLELV